MDFQSKISELKDLGSGYYFTAEMQSLSDQAASGDVDSLEILNQMTSDCKDPALWKENCRYCSAVLSAIAHAGTSKSLQVLLNFIKGLPDEMPYGAVDLIGSLLPGYKNLIIGNIKDLAIQNKNASQKAIGLHALSNMALDNELSEDDLVFLLQLFDRFDGDRYFSSDFIDIARSHIKRILKNFEENEDLLDSILVEG